MPRSPIRPLIVIDEASSQVEANDLRQAAAKTNSSGGGGANWPPPPPSRSQVTQDDDAEPIRASLESLCRGAKKPPEFVRRELDSLGPFAKSRPLIVGLLRDGFDELDHSSCSANFGARNNGR